MTTPDWMFDDDYDEDGNLDVEWYPIPSGLLRPDPDELSKAWTPPAGYSPTPGSTKGSSFRRRKKGGKGWDYVYAPTAQPIAQLATKEQRHAANSAALERDPTRSVGDIKPGEIVEVGGRGGRYKWVPGAKRSGELSTAVQSMATGAVELVRLNTLVPLRKRKPAATPPKKQGGRKVPPPPPPVREGGGRKKSEVIPSDWPEDIPLPPTTSVPTAGTRKAAVWAYSTAPPGSALEAMENGSLMLRQFQGRHDRRLRLTIEVPPQMKEQLAVEMTGVFHQAARKVAKNFRPPISVVIPGTNTLHPDYKELVAGAQLGFVMALTNYRGGRAFIPVAQDYATVYALQAARGTRRGHALKERDLRALKGYIAARSRAHGAKQIKAGGDPTREEIVSQWYLTKRMVFTGRGESLGNYDTGEKIVDQAHEQVPMEEWQVKTPVGAPAGKMYPGKLKLAAKMEQLLGGEDVPDLEWLQQAPQHLLPQHEDQAMSAGTALHVRQEVIEIIASMREPHAQALAMRFGMHTPEDEDPDALHAKKLGELKAMAKDRGLPSGGNKSQLAASILQWSAGQVRPGTKGYEATAVNVADSLGIGQNLTPASRGAKVRRIWKEGIASFTNKAWGKNAAVAEYVKMWATDLAEDPKPDGRREGPMLPSHQWLKDRFGTDERVLVYQAAMRAGNGASTGRMLEREKHNELTPQESAKLREEYHAQLRVDAQAAFDRYKAVTVDPDKVHDIGPHTGTPGEAEWLYSSNVLTGYMRALISGDTNPPKKGKK